MATTLDNTNSSTGANAPSTGATMATLVIGSGTDRIVFGCISWSLGGGVSNVMFSGNAMTLVTTFSGGTGSTGRAVGIWYFLNPASGSGTLTADLTGSGQLFVSGLISFSAVSQTAPVGTFGTDGGTSRNSLSATTTSTSSDIVLAVMTARDSAAVTIGGSQTGKWATFANVNIAGVGTIQTGGTGVNSTFSWTTADNSATIAVPVLSDAGGGGGTTNESSTLSLMGVG